MNLLFPGCDASSKTIFWFRCLFCDILLVQSSDKDTCRYVKASWIRWHERDFDRDLPVVLMITLFGQSRQTIY